MFTMHLRHVKSVMDESEKSGKPINEIMFEPSCDYNNTGCGDCRIENKLCEIEEKAKV